MTFRRQPTQFRSKFRYFAKRFRNFITKMSLTSHSTTKFFKGFTKFRLIKSSLNGGKIEPFVRHFYFSFCKNFTTEIKNSLRTKNSTNSSLIRQSCPIYRRFISSNRSTSRRRFTQISITHIIAIFIDMKEFLLNSPVYSQDLQHQHLIHYPTLNLNYNYLHVSRLYADQQRPYPLPFALFQV